MNIFRGIHDKEQKLEKEEEIKKKISPICIWKTNITICNWKWFQRSSSNKIRIKHVYNYKNSVWQIRTERQSKTIYDRAIL